MKHTTSVHGHALRMFKSFLKCLPIDDLRALISFCESYDVYSVYVYDVPTKTSHRAEHSELPWFIAFVLSHYNRKHIFACTNRVDNNRMMQYVSQWYYKFAWRTYVASQPSTSESEEVGIRFVNKKASTPHAPTLFPRGIWSLPTPWR